MKEQKLGLDYTGTIHYKLSWFSIFANHPCFPYFNTLFVLCTQHVLYFSYLFFFFAMIILFYTAFFCNSQSLSSHYSPSILLIFPMNIVLYTFLTICDMILFNLFRALSIQYVGRYVFPIEKLFILFSSCSHSTFTVSSFLHFLFLSHQLLPKILCWHYK